MNKTNDGTLDPSVSYTNLSPEALKELVEILEPIHGGCQIVAGKVLDSCETQVIDSIQAWASHLVEQARIQWYKDWLEWLDGDNETSVESITTTMKDRLNQLSHSNTEGK